TVGGAGDPAGIGGSPEDVVLVEVEREPAGGVVRDDRLVHVQRALGLAGGAAGEVQQRRRLRVGGADIVVGIGCREQPGQVERSVGQRALFVASQQHVLERGQFT